MKKSKLALAGAAISALLLAGCAPGASNDGGGDAPESKGALVASFPSAQITIWNDILAAMEPMAEEAGYELLSSDPQWDVQKQVADWQGWIQRGDVKAIIGYPEQVDAIVPVTAEALAAGIPVVGYGTAWEGVEYNFGLNPFADGEILGTEAGEWIVETYGDSEVHVALIGDRGTDLSRMRLEGIEQGLADAGAKVKTYDLAASTREDAYNHAQSQLAGVPDTKVWLAVGDPMALGAYQAVIDSGVAPDADGYLVSGLDAGSESFDLIEKPGSIWRFGMALKAQEIAEAMMGMLLAAVDGTLSSNEVVQSQLVNADNVAEFRG